MILPKFQMFREISGWNYRKMTVFVLTNFNSTFEQDLERVYILRDMGYNPYIMIYDKAHTTGKDNVRKLQRWVNNRILFRSVPIFEEYIVSGQYSTSCNEKSQSRTDWLFTI